MARPRSKPSKTTRTDELKNLSSEVLRLRLQNLNLPITGSRARLLERLRLATNSAPAATLRHTRGRLQNGRVRKNTPSASNVCVHPRPQPNIPTEQADAETHSSDEDGRSDVDSATDELLEDFEPEVLHDSVFSPAQMSAIQETVSTSVTEALRVFQNHEARSDDLRTPSPRTLNTATPLGLHRPLEKSLEDKIFRARTIRRRIVPTRTQAENLAAKPWSALTSTNPPDVNAVPAISRTIAVAAAQATTPCSTALVPNRPEAATDQSTPAIAARNKVEQRQLDCNPTVSTPLNVDKLAFELVNHPNSSFVSNLISALRYGTRIGYLGPHKTRVSRNLISASQHPEVVSGNLQKEVQLGRIAGPFPSPPLPNLQCHPIGVVPKKHSVEWRTIYHLSYPEGDSINDHIPKDPYSLQYVRVDDAIAILRSLGPGSFMAKTDLKSAFRLMPIHPEDWNLLGIYWQSQYYIDLYLPFGLRSAPFLFNQISDALEWILKHNYGLRHVIHILDDFLVEHKKIDCLGSFATILKVFMSLRVPTVTSKTMGPSQVLEFMGVVLDSIPFYCISLFLQHFSLLFHTFLYHTLVRIFHTPFSIY